MLRQLAYLGTVAVALPGAACAPKVPPESWTCDFDASENRPLADPDASSDDAGVLPAAVCKATCGPPVDSCTATTLDGGVPGAICPVCTF
ncbi:MAG: hypothetical protein ACRELB_27485 [Polyangiaceae bacterium]